MHELTHAGTTYKGEYNGKTVRVGTYSTEAPTAAGMHYEEAVITNLIYQLKTMNTNTDEKSIYYTVPCSYYRIIQDCIGYDGNDLMNHSVNYFADKMGDFMGDREDSDEYALYILQLISYEYQLKNCQYLSIDVDSFQPLYDYITKMYCKKYIQPGMTSLEAEEVFNNLMEQMTWNLENLSVEYDENNMYNFRPAFEEYCESMGIELSQGIHR